MFNNVDDSLKSSGFFSCISNSSVVQAIVKFFQRVVKNITCAINYLRGQQEKTATEKTSDIKISERHVSTHVVSSDLPLVKIAMNKSQSLRSATDPHSGNYYGFGESETNEYQYTTTDDHDKQTKNGGVVKIAVTKKDKTFSNEYRFDYQYVTTEPCSEVLKSILPDVSNKSHTALMEEIKETLKSTSKEKFPPIRIVSGDVTLQRAKVVELAKESKSRVVICNASQLNYQEQVHENHDIKNDIQTVYKDYTFGPGIVKCEKGGVELLAHTLIKGNQIKFCGALASFFHQLQDSSPALYKKIENKGGYYITKFTKSDWKEFGDQLAKSSAQVEGFCWSQQQPTMKGKTEDCDVSVETFQTGAINSGNKKSGIYKHLHKDTPPSEYVEFLILFFQIRNAMLHEGRKQKEGDGQSIAYYSTRIGEGVFGNTKNVSMVAHLMAFKSLPDDIKSKYSSINIGSYDQNAVESVSNFMHDFNFSLTVIPTK